MITTNTSWPANAAQRVLFGQRTYNHLPKNSEPVDRPFLIQSRVYDTCPNTEPSTIDAEYWFNRLMDEKDWSSCRSILDDYDCVEDLGYGAENAGGTHKYYKPGESPKNGTETLSNTNGVISTPISGTSFTWDYSTDVHTVIAKSTDYVATASAAVTPASTTDTRSDTDVSQTDTGAGNTATGKSSASVFAAQLWRIIGLVVILDLGLIW